MAETMGVTGDARSDQPAATESGNNTIAGSMTDAPKTNNNKADDYSLKVKPEYVLSERAASLPPVPGPSGSDLQVDDANNSGGGGTSGNNSKKKNRGQNKKRPRDARQDAGEKLCMAVMRGDPCPREAEGQECRFSHDLEAFMKTRPPDIDVGDGCPNFNMFGYCMYGAMCRFGSVHIDKSGRNVRKEADSAETEQPIISTDEAKKKETAKFSGQQDEGIVNHLPREVAIQLRKKTYPFKCKRHFENEKDNAGDGKQEDELAERGAADGASSFTPLDKPNVKKIVDFSNKVYVAPLTTVGNLPFRRIMKGFGADITCGEMAVVPNLLQGQPSEWALLKRHPSEDVFGVQLAAAHPDQYTRVSELIDKYCQVDFVDLNLGCPLDILCNKGAGAALMMRDRKLKPILCGMSETLTSASITVKMRTGWDMEKPFAHTLVPKIQSWGVDGLAAIMVSF